MDCHIVVVFTEEEYVGLKYESYIAVEFQNSEKATFQKAPERAEFFLALHNDFYVIKPEFMMRLQQLDKIGEIEVFLILAWLAIILIDFVYDFLCDHIDFKM